MNKDFCAESAILYGTLAFNFDGGGGGGGGGGGC